MLFSVRTIVSQIFAVEWGRQVKIEKEEQLKSFKIPGLWVFWCFIISDYKGTGAGGSDSIAAAAVAEQCSAWEPWELRSWYLVWTLITHVTSNTGLWLVNTGHVTLILASDWLLQCCRHRLMAPAWAACCSSQDDCSTLINTQRLWCLMDMAHLFRDEALMPDICESLGALNDVRTQMQWLDLK